MSYRVTIAFAVERDEEEIDLTVLGSCTYATRGRSSGPPELCEEDEPATAEIDSILVDGVKWDGELSEAEEEAALEKMLEADGPEPDYDDGDEGDFEDREVDDCGDDY